MLHAANVTKLVAQNANRDFYLRGFCRSTIAPTPTYLNHVLTSTDITYLRN